MCGPHGIESISVPKCPNHNTIMGARIMVSNQISHGKVIGNILAGEISRLVGPRESTTSEGGNLNTRGSFTGDRWTPTLTQLVNIMTHSTFLQSNVSVFPYSCASFIYQPKQTCRRIFRYIGLRETQASSACSNDSEEVNNKNADMDCHAVPAPAHQAGGDSIA